MNGSRDRVAAAPNKPAFLITVDTEGDNIWSNPREITTENSKFIPRFQQLCEKYGLKPTYLTNHEMATSEAFVEFARDALSRGTAEVGLHIHAWNSPPVRDESALDGMAYLIEYPAKEMAEKVTFMTDLLEDRFGEKMVSHRAGRWAFNETYARILLDHGYTTDCSVTPYVSWKEDKGFVGGAGGTDYRAFPTEPYFIDPSDISRAGGSQLLEVPMTIARNRSLPGDIAHRAAKTMPKTIRKIVDHAFPAVSWFRPHRGNGPAMRKLLRDRWNSDYIEFMLHSSELMPGGSPRFRTGREIEQLYEQLEQLFEDAQVHFQGETLREFRDRYDDASVAETSQITAVAAD